MWLEMTNSEATVCARFTPYLECGPLCHHMIEFMLIRHQTLRPCVISYLGYSLDMYINR